MSNEQYCSLFIVNRRGQKMAQQAAVETIASWTEEQLKQTISEMVKESISVVRPKRDFYEEFEDSLKSWQS